MILDKRLDRLVEFDKRSRSFSISDVLKEEKIKKPRSYKWQCDQTLDQGKEGACVGFAWSHELIARPSRIIGLHNQFASDLYKLAKRFDPWPGENYEGTSVLAGVKAVQVMHPSWIPEYRWSFDFNDLILTLGYFGPVVLGISWYASMYSPVAGKVIVDGPVVGGHAILANGVNIKTKTVRLHNSWGKDWGVSGEAEISFKDLEKLLSNQGECCIPLRRKPGGEKLSET